jgi:hypothetical protein
MAKQNQGGGSTQQGGGQRQSGAGQQDGEQRGRESQRHNPQGVQDHNDREQQERSGAGTAQRGSKR